MNYYEPRELKNEDGTNSGRWHYTVRNDGRVWPVGYCREPGDDGHATADEACAHYRQYELDHATYDGHWRDTQHRCEVEGCEAWTNRFASYGPGRMSTHNLCDEHCNRETLERIAPPVWQSFGSY